MPLDATATPPRAKRGLFRPFQRSGAADVATATSDDLLAAQVKTVLGSDTGLPWRHRFRARLDRLRNQRNKPSLAEFARFYCADALRRWLPSVVVLGVTATTRPRAVDLLVSVARRDDRRPRPRIIDVPITVLTG